MSPQPPFSQDQNRERSKLPCETTEDEEEIKEMTVSLAAAREIHMHNAIAVILSDLDGIFRL